MDIQFAIGRVTDAVAAYESKITMDALATLVQHIEDSNQTISDMQDMLADSWQVVNDLAPSPLPVPDFALVARARREAKEGVGRTIREILS